LNNNQLDLDDYSDDGDMPADDDKAASGAAAAPKAEKDEDYSDDEAQYLDEFDKVKK